MPEYHDIINNSLQSLLEQWLGEQVFYERDKITKQYESNHEITCHICFYDFALKRAGVALLNVDKQVLVRLWEKVYKSPVEDLDSVAEIGSELLNTLTGRALEAFNERGMSMHLSLPNIIENSPQLKLSTFGRDDFYYYAFSAAEIRFSWVLCFYDAKEFA